MIFRNVLCSVCLYFIAFEERSVHTSVHVKEENNFCQGVTADLDLRKILLESGVVYGNIIPLDLIKLIYLQIMLSLIC